jgi:hypothetical protein
MKSGERLRGESLFNFVAIEIGRSLIGGGKEFYYEIEGYSWNWISLDGICRLSG